LFSSLVAMMRTTEYCAEWFISPKTSLAFEDLLDFDCIITGIHMPVLGRPDPIRVLHEQSIAIPVISIAPLSDKHRHEPSVSHETLCRLKKTFEIRFLPDWVERNLLQ
jgi:FixJ family two-component response regulator